MLSGDGLAGSAGHLHNQTATAVGDGAVPEASPRLGGSPVCCGLFCRTWMVWLPTSRTAMAADSTWKKQQKKIP